AGVFRAKRLLPDEIERELDYFCETIRAATWMAIREADASPPEERSAHDAPGMATPHHRLYGPPAWRRPGIQGLQNRNGTIAIQYPLGPRPREGGGWAWSGRVVADSDNWELVMTAAQRRRLEAQWRKDDPEDEDKEEDDGEQDA